MTGPAKKLRLIRYTDAAGASWSAFAALTDAELATFTDSPNIAALHDMGRVVHVVAGEPSESDRKAAVQVFGHAHGSRAIPHD
ncbi:hypothetical protein [Novosphingobium sp. FKTRR1]|uniref:hypothetical protein n=1 Tax=Novosphingobium sp. FKTRR1 TaxID=2879118 RepID=UPI001CF0A7E0|nr:hypothetical protein [Novosphingobium sp. FKTRR1]